MGTVSSLVPQMKSVAHLPWKAFTYKVSAGPRGAAPGATFPLVCIGAFLSDRRATVTTERPRSSDHRGHGTRFPELKAVLLGNLWQKSDAPEPVAWYLVLDPCPPRGPAAQAALRLALAHGGQSHVGGRDTWPSSACRVQVTWPEVMRCGLQKTTELKVCFSLLRLNDPS